MDEPLSVTLDSLARWEVKFFDVRQQWSEQMIITTNNLFFSLLLSSFPIQNLFSFRDISYVSLAFQVNICYL